MIRWTRALVRSRIVRDRRSTVATMVGLAGIPMALTAGLALDGTRVWLLQTRLQQAVDASVLLAASAGETSLSQTQVQTDTSNLFWADFGRTSRTGNAQTGFINSGFLNATMRDTALSVTFPDANHVQVIATATLPMTFMNLTGMSTISVSASGTAERAGGVEVALVLDNTGSMKGWPIQTVQTSATELVNILYGHAPNDTSPSAQGTDTQSNLWLSIVPFVAEVNIGPSHTGWLTPGTYDLNSGAYSGTYDTSNTQTQQWMGCVMARTGTPDEFTDAPPTTTSFTPFVYPSTLNQYTANGKVVKGDDDWSNGNITEANQTNLPDNTAVGPNLGCPNLPVMGLQASRNAAMNVISQMVANFRGGTFINLGLQAGWWTLSPRWRGLWNASYPQLPLDYGTANMQKVIVLMTDGNNEWYDWPGGAPGAGPPGWQNDGDTDYTAYGRLKMGLAGSSVSQSSATTYINNAMSNMCTTIKSNGITIYTVLFNHDGSVTPATETLFQNCASKPGDYYLAQTDSDLQAAFTAIGAQIAKLRLTQ
ncbi:MAG: Flp pilus assembly protein TadG [Acetobacteraceae bacterium]|nr:Flp pilus assembly protein TadG [Acetobacteraceae bacterium]